MTSRFRNIIPAAAACLAFQGELMAGKRLLPQFGGSASVWCGTVLFFQLAVLAAYFGSRWLGQADVKTRNLTLAALGLSGFLTLLWPLPILQWLPPELQPLAALLPFGGLAIGLFCATPLLHRQQADRNDFTIYAWSNAGALAGLIAYPLWVEPFTDLKLQNWVWAAAGALVCILGIGGKAPGLPEAQEQNGGLGKTRWQWWILPAVSSATLLATTNQLSYEASAGPLTWALPLAIFLASYVWAFSGNRRTTCGFFATVGLAAMVASRLNYRARSNLSLEFILLAGGATMLACHVWLAAARNENTHGFYTASAASGAMGSALMVLVVPHITDGPVEFPILTVGTLTIAGFRWSGRIIRPILSTVAFVAIGATIAAESAGRAKEVARARTLYTCWRVTKKPDEPVYSLISNTTLHAQEDRAHPDAATTYYGPETGFGKMIAQKRQFSSALNIAVVGLGAGTLNRYLRPNDEITYYELDAEAETLARAWFTYLRRGRSRVIIGDGRKSLENETGPKFDIIVLDAFTGDAVPTHLLTREAGAIYRHRMKDDGVLAVHITNAHVQLLPVAEGLARGLGMGCDYYNTGLIEWAIVRAGAAPPSGRILEWTDERNSIVSVLGHAPHPDANLPDLW